jgi:hypothetical protein
VRQAGKLRHRVMAVTRHAVVAAHDERAPPARVGAGVEISCG